MTNQKILVNYVVPGALDLIRLGGKRENKIAKEILENHIWNQ